MRDLCNNRRRKTESFTWEELHQHLADALNLSKRTTVIIDALDECILEQDREDLIGMFSKLMAEPKRRLLVFVSGRPEFDIHKALGGRVVVKIGVEDNERDIAKFVQEKMTKHSRWDKFSEATQLKVVKTLREKSRGMSVSLPAPSSSLSVVTDEDIVLRFRLTALQVEELLGKLMEEDIIAHLGRLPKDLTAAYDGIYSRQIEEPGGVESAVAERALLWVLAAREPVSSPLLLPAVRINVDCYNDQFRNAGNTNSNLSSIRNTPDCGKDITSEVDKDLLQRLCTNLLTLDSRTDKWTFTHASVVEYLEEHRFSSMHAHDYLGSACLLLTVDLSKSVSAKRPVGAWECLPLGPQFDDGSWLAAKPEQDLDPQPHEPWKVHRSWLRNRKRKLKWPGNRNPLVKYAITWWPGHVARVAQELEGSTGKEIDHRQGNTADSHTSNKTDGLKLLVESFFDDSTDGNAAYRFWCDWALISLQDPEDYGFTSKSGSRNMGTRVTLLIESIMRKDMVLTVVALGLFDFLSGRMWLEKITVDMQGIRLGSRGSYLHVASLFGPASLVSALLDAGMDINGRTSDGQLPLTVAIRGRCLETLKLLFNRGGYDPNSLTGHDNPLYQAVMDNYADGVSYLISVKADPNQDPGGGVEWEHGSALAQAVVNNNGAVLRVLLEEGKMDPNVPVSSRMGSAAILAAYHLKLDALRCLILSGRVEPNTRVTDSDSEYKTIMDAAACKILEWKDDVVSCLRECGVDFSIQTIDDLDALHRRIEGDRSLSRERFGKKQVRCGSLLESVSARGTLSAVRFVVEEWGQDVNALSDEGDFGSPLIAAAFNKHNNPEVLEYLLNQGAEINCQVPAGIYHSALAAALSYWKKPVGLEAAGVLVKHGVNVSLPLEYGDFGSVLAFAASGRLDPASSRTVGRTNQDVDRSCNFLIENGAEVNTILKHGKFGSALVAAAASGSVQSLKLLLDAGADPNLPLDCGDYGSPLIYAASTGYTANVLYLLDRGADINYASTQGGFATALLAAASGGHEETFRCLVNKGADLNLPENRDAEFLLALRCQQMQEYY